MAAVSAALSRPCAAAALPSARPSPGRLGALAAAAPRHCRRSVCSSAGRPARLQCHAVAEAVRPEAPSPGKLVAPGQSQQQVGISRNAAGGRRDCRPPPPPAAAACRRLRAAPTQLLTSSNGPAATLSLQISIVYKVSDTLDLGCGGPAGSDCSIEAPQRGGVDAQAECTWCSCARQQAPCPCTSCWLLPAAVWRLLCGQRRPHAGGGRHCVQLPGAPARRGAVGDGQGGQAGSTGRTWWRQPQQQQQHHQLVPGHSAAARQPCMRRRCCCTC
jgi:hypothetical protein